MVDDLKPNTEYEFTVKIVRGKRQVSYPKYVAYIWTSLVILNVYSN